MVRVWPNYKYPWTHGYSISNLTGGITSELLKLKNWIHVHAIFIHDLVVRHISIDT